MVVYDLYFGLKRVPTVQVNIHFFGKRVVSWALTAPYIFFANIPVH